MRIWIPCLSLLASALLSNAATAQDATGVASVDSSSTRQFAWEAAPATSPFREGNWVAMTGASAIAATFEDDARFIGGHAGLGYYFMDNVSINGVLGGNYGYRLFDAEKRDEGDFWGTTLDVFLRCHVAQCGSWTAFVEGGTGFSLWNKSIPSGGTHWNFILLAGGGFTKQINDCVSFIAGVRWYHLSNSGLLTAGGNNPGFDGTQVYAGFSFIDPDSRKRLEGSANF